MACDEAVYLAVLVISLELTYRWYNSIDNLDLYLEQQSFDVFKNHIYVIFYILSICSTLIYVKGLNKIPLPMKIEPYVPLLYLFDSIAAIGLGISLYYENRNDLLISMVVLTNFFLLHILHTLFSKKGGTLVSKINYVYICTYIFTYICK
jgi:hypothetical protein